MNGIINRITAKLTLRQPPARMTAAVAELALEQGRISRLQVAEILWSDPMSAANILKRANESYYGMRGSVGSLLHAIEVLGPESCLKMLSTGSEYSFESPATDAVIRHARATGHISHRLATGTWMAFNNSASRPGFVATTGLLHSIGRLALCASFPAETESLYGFSELSFPVSGSRTELEQLQFGIDYAEIGEFISRKLNLPSEITEAVRGHLSPSHIAKDSPARKLSAIVAAATYIADKTGYGMEPQVSIPFEAMDESLNIFRKEAALQDGEVARVCEELHDMNLNTPNLGFEVSEGAVSRGAVSKPAADRAPSPSQPVNSRTGAPRNSGINRTAQVPAKQSKS